MHQTELEKMIEGCIQKDKRSQKKLYETFSSKMYAVCLRYMNNREEAQDVLQEGFIKIYTKIGTYKFDGVFEGWMRRVFVNTALEQLRSKRRKFEERFEDSHNALNAVENEAVQKIDTAEIMKALRQLATGYRTVFNLYVIEGYSHAEIAEKLGMSEATSKSQLSRARVILQRLILKKHV
jgi:RNA polymerase sigma factor (sigma-70 family)